VIRFWVHLLVVAFFGDGAFTFDPFKWLSDLQLCGSSLVTVIESPKLNSTQFWIVWQLRKDRYSQTARIFCRQQLGPIKGPGSPGVRLLRQLKEGIS